MIDRAGREVYAVYEIPPNSPMVKQYTSSIRSPVAELRINAGDAHMPTTCDWYGDRKLDEGSL
jgi:hypothetical protein